MITNLRSFKLPISLACALGASLAAGCIAPTVVGGDDGSGASGGGGGDGISSNALALRYDELPSPGGGGTTGTTVGGGAEPDPATLFIHIDSSPLTCGDPYSGGSGPCGAGWHVSVGLPPAYQAVGTYDLSDGSILSSFSESLGHPDGSCSGWGGSFWEGTLEVVSIDGQEVVVRLEGSAFPAADGEHTALRCSPVAPPSAEGIAIRADQIPPVGGGGNSTSASGGGGLDPATLFVMVGDHPIACAEPFATTCGVPAWSVSVGLPVAYQTPGTYSLSDPDILSSYSVTLASPPGECAGGGGSFMDGSIEVLSIDSSGLSVRFVGVADFAAELGQDRFVPRCP